MKAITKNYLIDIISRIISVSIDAHRASKQKQPEENYAMATDEELLDFIHTIPYFDIRLKDFLVGNIGEQTIIIGQQWEIEFVKKVRSWGESFEWLHADERFL